MNRADLPPLYTNSILAQYEKFVFFVFFFSSAPSGVFF
jgi:hypothetical protein